MVTKYGDLQIVFVQERGTGEGKTLTLLSALEFGKREGMETELRLRESSGERLQRGRKNEVRDAILHSSTQSLEQVFDFSAEENAIE